MMATKTIFLCIALINLCESNNVSYPTPKGVSGRGILNGVSFPKWNKYHNLRKRFPDQLMTEARFWPPVQKESRCK